MNKSLSNIAILTVAGLAAVSCHRESARLQGNFVGAAGKPIYLERVVPGNTAVIDTTAADDKGGFGFRINLKDRQPTIFNLRYDGDMVPLLISPGERVRVSSLGNVSRSYKVSGSADSELVGELHGIMTGGMATLDSIGNLFALSSPEGSERKELTRAYYEEYYRIKRSQIRFIVEHTSSLAAVYALYQRLPGDDVLFNGESDLIYYRMVSDSVRRNYPESRYVMALEKEIETRNAQTALQDRLLNNTVEVADYPEIDLPNMYGQKTKLSSMAGKVIVLDFWSATMTESNVNNAEMKELYAEYSDKGLAVYQVSIDTSKPLWVNAVQEQKLPWTTVCDFRGEQSPAVRMYNITAIPANFVIDRDGNIAAKNLYGEALSKKIQDLL
jgi:peroxiredoxin